MKGAKRLHRLTNINDTTRMAHCSSCGSVFIVKKDNKDGKVHWRCGQGNREKARKTWRNSKNCKGYYTRAEQTQPQLCVYFVQAENKGLIKIGASTDAKKRLRQLQCGSPARLSLLATIDGNSEAMLHTKFKHLRHHGEWFEPHQELLDFIKREALPPK